jgi:hypothetical protein
VGWTRQVVDRAIEPAAGLHGHRDELLDRGVVGIDRMWPTAAPSMKTENTTMVASQNSRPKLGAMTPATPVPDIRQTDLPLEPAGGPTDRRGHRRGHEQVSAAEDDAAHADQPGEPHLQGCDLPVVGVSGQGDHEVDQEPRERQVDDVPPDQAPALLP